MVLVLALGMSQYRQGALFTSKGLADTNLYGSVIYRSNSNYSLAFNFLSDVVACDVMHATDIRQVSALVNSNNTRSIHAQQCRY